MSHKLIGFADSSNSVITQYIIDQLSAISNEIDGLVTEISDETDSRLERHSKTHNRMPCLMLLKNDSYKIHIHAKMTNQNAINWTKEKMG